MSVKFNGWDVVAISCKMDHHSMTEMATVFVSKGDESYYLYDEFEKMKDVAKMPPYISEDWVNYNKKELNVKILDKYIKEFSESGLTESDYTVSELKSIKREFLLKKII